MNKFFITLTVLLCVLLFTNACSLNKKVVGQQTQLNDNNLQLNINKTSEINTNLGSLLYGSDKNTINIILNLDLVQIDGVRISFDDFTTGKGALLGEGNSLLKLGSIKNDTILVPENNGLRLWAQFPIRFLSDGKIKLIKITDVTSGKIILQEKLTF